MLSYRPGCVEDYGAGRGISYGSLYNYDARVPLLLLRPAIPRGRLRSIPWKPSTWRPPWRGLAGVAPPSSSVGRVLGEALAATAGRRNEPPRPAPGHLALRAGRCANPVIAASGTFGYGVEFEKLVDLEALGGLVVKGLSREPIDGNPPPAHLRSRAPG